MSKDNNNSNSNSPTPYGTIGSIAQGAVSILPNWYEDDEQSAQITDAIYGNSKQDPLARLFMGHGSAMNAAEKEIDDNIIDFSEINNNQNLYNAWDNSNLQNDINYQFGWKNLADNLTASATGASYGLQIGGPWGALIGGIAGGLANIGSQIGGSSRADILNAHSARANSKMINNYYNQAVNNTMRAQRNGLRNLFAEGGELGLNGIQKIQEGGTHGQNAYGGVQVGVAPDGLPNKVEEGEVIYNDYVYSARLKASKTLLDKYNLPTKYAGKSFAEVADKLQKESEERPNDPISLSTLKDFMARLQDAQEEHRAKAENRRLAREFDALPEDTKQAVAAQAMSQMMPQESMGMDQLAQQPALAAEEPLGTQEPSLNTQEVMAEDGGHLFAVGGPDDPPNSYGWNTTLAPIEYVPNEADQLLTTLYGRPEYNPQDFKIETNLSPVTNPITIDSSQAYPLFNSKGEFIVRNWDTVYSDPNDLPGPDKYGKFENFPNFYTVGTVNGVRTPGWNPGVWNMYGNIDQEWFDAVSKLPEFQKLKHKPKDVEQARKWLRDDWKGVGGSEKNVQDFHAFVHSLKYKDGKVTTHQPVKENLTLGALNPEGFIESEDVGDEGAGSAGGAGKEGRDDNFQLPRKSELARYAPVIGSGLGTLFSTLQGPDYTYANQLRDIASGFNPIAAPALGGYRRYTPYDVNLANNEAMAQLAAAQRANVANGNRATQAAGLVALENAFARESANRNLAWQQANEANRLETDKYNLGIDQINLNTTQHYDDLNQQIRERRLGMLAAAAKAQDDSATAWAQNISNNATNLFNNLGNLGRDNWNYNQRNALLEEYGMEGLARILGLTT